MVKQAEIVWAVAHLQPSTTREIANFLGAPDAEVTTVTTETYKHGLLVRRGTDKPRCSYEYRLITPEEAVIE